MKPRPYQLELESAIKRAWQDGSRTVLAMLPTGGGKTKVISDLLVEHHGAACIMAHRNELVSQVSLALARHGVRHNLICAKQEAADIAASHVEALQRVYYDPCAPVSVASVDTLIRRSGLDAWRKTVSLCVIDEGHHALQDNKWGKAFSLFPNARGLLMTATPCRADGKGLGSHHDGIADIMVRGPDAAWLIDHGYLTPYRVYGADSHIRDFLGDVAASGDWSTAAMREASKKSQIVGDVVESYVQFAEGKLGITFSTDVETAREIAEEYNGCGVKAAVLTGDVPGPERRRMLRDYAARRILQLVAVDVISEGFDLPACEVVTMARPTQSLSTYLQQFGRGLRPAPGKSHCILIDHVNNFLTHRGGPDAFRAWSLDRRDTKTREQNDASLALRYCTNKTCCRPYEAYRRACPHCGHKPVPKARSGPEAVSGVLTELDDSIIQMLRLRIQDVDAPAEVHRQRLVAKGCPAIGVAANVRRHEERKAAQRELREMMELWGGFQRACGLTDEEMQARFYLRFNTDVLSAQALGATEAMALREQILEQMA